MKELLGYIHQHYMFWVWGLLICSVVWLVCTAILALLLGNYRQLLIVPQVWLVSTATLALLPYIARAYG